MTSVHALEAMNEHSVYAGTKGAIVSFTRQLAIELIPSGVHVNAVAPGAVLVENHFKVVNNLDPEALGAGVPVGYMGRPDDIAQRCAFSWLHRRLVSSSARPSSWTAGRPPGCLSATVTKPGWMRSSARVRARACRHGG